MSEPTGVLFDSLLTLMTRLRGPGGCPWDREQTRDSLKPFLIEEAYEVLDALEAGNREALLEELGDLLFQVVFHAQLAHELGEFGMRDVLQHLIAKMTRRHPHVFGDRTVSSAREALAQWEAIKHAEASAEERSRSVLEGVPRSLPALLRAQRLQAKASRVGFDWQSPEAAWAKVQEEVGELNAALARDAPPKVREEFGDLLFSLVNVARLLGMDAEGSLQAAAEKFRRRFEDMEAEITSSGRALPDTPLAELDRVWERVKARDGTPAGEGTADS